MLMSASGLQVSLAAGSSSRPKYLSFSQTRLRISGEPSPTPAVKTKASIPPKRSRHGPDCFHNAMDINVNGESRVRIVRKFR